MRYILLFNASQVPGGINWLCIVFNLLTKGFSFVEARRHKLLLLQSKRSHQKAFLRLISKKAADIVRDDKPLKRICPMSNMKAFGFLNDRIIFSVACIRVTIFLRHSQIPCRTRACLRLSTDANRADQFSSKLLQQSK